MRAAGADIRRSLELMLEGAEQHKPQLFFCKLGEWVGQGGCLAARRGVGRNVDSINIQCNLVLGCA